MTWDPAHSQRKGAQAEKDALALFHTLGLPEVELTPWSGARGIPGDLTGIDGWHIEVKHVERFHLREAQRQAAAQAPEGSVPVVMYRYDDLDFQVTLPADALIQLLVQVRELQQQLNPRVQVNVDPVLQELGIIDTDPPTP